MVIAKNIHKDYGDVNVLKGVDIHIKKGEIVNEKDLVFLRPNNGISAIDYNILLGKKCKESILALAPLNINLFE